MKGMTVITSKEPMPYVLAVEELKNVPHVRSDKQSMITWKFDTEDDAIKYSNRFMNIGFEYVKRV